MQEDDSELVKLAGWYANDAAYLRGFAFGGNPDGSSEDSAKHATAAIKKRPSSHPEAWQQFKESITKQPKTEADPQ